MMNFRKIAVGILTALAMCMSSSAFDDERVRTSICGSLTPDGSFPVEFTKEWYEHKCRIIYATHGGYAPGASRKAIKKSKQRSNPSPLGCLSRECE